MSQAPPAPPAAQWSVSTRPDKTAVIAFSGELDTVSTPAAWSALESELSGIQAVRLEVDARQISSCDSAGLALLYHLCSGGMTPGIKGELVGLDPGLQRLYRSFSGEASPASQETGRASSNWVEEIGAAASSWFSGARQQVEFIGELARDIATSVFRPRRMRWGEVLRIFETAGVNALPIVALLTFLVGMVIAFESAQPLAKMGAQVFVADLLGLVMSRELGPVMAAIMLAGRSGSAFAAELGTMKVNEELNALQTMGLSPIQFLVAQRVVAGILLAPVLTIFAMCSGILGGIPVLMGLGFPLRTVLVQIQTSLHYGDLAEGLSKSVVFGAIVAGVSCRCGLQTGEGPRAVGESTTRSVVNSILLIIVADSVFAALTYKLRQ